MFFSNAILHYAPVVKLFPGIWHRPSDVLNVLADLRVNYILTMISRAAEEFKQPEAQQV